MKPLPRVNLDDKIFTLKYYVDEDYAHLRIRDEEVCRRCPTRPCLSFCPAGVYRLDRSGGITVSYQACVECGSCRVACPYANIEWNYPRGGFGVAYKFG